MEIAWKSQAWARPQDLVGLQDLRTPPQHARGGTGTEVDRVSGSEHPPLDDEPMEAKLRRVLGVLFLVKEPLSTRKLSEHASLADGTEARTLLNHLNRWLDTTGRAFRVEGVGGGYLLTTRRQFAKWLKRLEYVPGTVRLTAPAMETLAVVAYRQPVIRAEVEAIRGVSCGEVLSQLLNRDLIRISGRSSDLGRPYLYSTTKRFLQVFGLRSLEELPPVVKLPTGSSDDAKTIHPTPSISNLSE